MPCSDVRPGDREREANMYEGAELLCEFCRDLEAEGQEVWPRFRRWWEVHKKLDAKYGPEA